MEPPKNSKCPLCKKPSVFEYRPFCSKRCADVDLAHWLRGDYTIEGDEEKQEGDNTKEE
ncbi:MAG: DNA gyrase inhibitor YacG [Alphaproteobacteria bacterium]|nr:DNA gyrase inhibitor YacG [Alphaproteobacteria bacterium]